MANIVFHAQFTSNKVGAVGKVVAVDIDRIARSDGTRTALVTAGSATEGIRGCYRYVLANADLQTYDYIGIFATSDTSVDRREIAVLWTRFSEAVATDAAGRVTAGSVADKGGYALAAVGLDQVVIEAGVNARQALSPILAASAGVLSGAGGSTVVINGGNAGPTRITATVDGAGNRTAVALSLPS